MMAVKAFAFLQERDYVLPDDVKTMAPYVISHRIVLRPESRLDSMEFRGRFECRTPASTRARLHGAIVHEAAFENSQ